MFTNWNWSLLQSYFYSVSLKKTCNGLCTQPNALKSNQTKKCHIDTHAKTKKWSYTCSEVLNPVKQVFRVMNSRLRSFTSSSSLYVRNCFKIVDDVDFFRTKIEPIVQVKSNLSWIFPNVAWLSQKVIQSQHKTVRRAVTTNVCGRKS